MKPRMKCVRHWLAGSVSATLAIAASPVLASDCKLELIADFPVKMEGHRVTVPVQVNGQDATFWLDSGAFFSFMSEAKAKELDLPLQALPPGFIVSGVGGSASVQLATIKSFGLVGHQLKDAQFLVGGSDGGSGFIGLNILAIADAEFDLAHGSVKLLEPKACKKDKDVLAYWSGGQQYFMVPLLAPARPNDRHFTIPVTINGVKLKAALDSGASTSVISRRAAERANIDISGPGVLPIDGMGGIGRKLKGGWSVPVDSVAIGDEQILHTHIDVVDSAIMSGADAPDMLLGADFMLAHHIYVARSQQRVYFTYSGGKPFVAAAFDRPASDKPDSAAASPTAAAAPVLPPDTRRVDVVDGVDAPKTASEFAGRGTARIAQRRLPDAIADLSEAIRLEPGNTEHYKDRAEAYSMSGKLDLAKADLEQALKLKPDDKDLLRHRAYLRYKLGDKVGALADAEAAAKLTAPTSLDVIALAALFERVGQPARAVPIIDPVIASHREDSALGKMLNLRCWVRALADVEIDKAIDDCDRAIKRDGAKSAYLDSRGLARFRSGDLNGALADYDAALAQNPKIAWSHFVRGLIKTSQGKAEEGKEDRDAALAIDPGITQEAEQYGVGQ